MWIKAQHGTAGWEQKLENLFSKEMMCLLDEVENQVIGEDEKKSNYYSSVVAREYCLGRNQLRQEQLQLLEEMRKKL